MVILSNSFPGAEGYKILRAHVRKHRGKLFKIGRQTAFRIPSEHPRAYRVLELLPGAIVFLLGVKKDFYDGDFAWFKVLHGEAIGYIAVPLVMVTE